MTNRRHGSRGRAYLYTMLAMGLSIWASWLLAPHTHGRTAFLPLIPAVMLVAWVGGLGSGLFATVLGALGGTYFLLDPPFSLRPPQQFYDWMRLLLFALCGVITSILSQLRLNAQHRADIALAEAEASHQQAEAHLQSLQRSEQQFRLLIDGAPDYAILMLDPEGRIISWNTGARRIKGYAPDEIIGKPYSCLFTPTDVTDGKPQHLLETARREGRVEDEGWRMRKDGSPYWADTIITAIRDEQGILRGFAKVTRDITERRKTEAELSEAKLLAAEAQQAKQFMATLSHELRTPLTPVLVAATALEHDSRLHAELLDEVGMIRRNVETEARLVNDLLDLSRSITGKLHLHFEAIDAHAAIRDVTKNFQGDMDAKHLVTTLALDAPESYVWADPIRFRQIVSNLLRNAVKFTPSGGALTLSSCTQDEQWVLRVHDTGIGIDPQYVSRVFDVYEQGDPTVSRQFGGLGLGLAISRTLATAQGGTIAAASEGHGHGATFTLTLRSVATPADIPAQPGSTAQASSAPAALTILLVEDNPDTCRILAKLLRRHGHEVVTANSVTQALQEFETRPFDLLVSDLGLPDGTGWDLLQRCRSQKQIKAIAVSGYGMEEDLQRSRESGFSLHLTKPLNPGKLDDAIRELACDSTPQSGCWPSGSV